VGYLTRAQQNVNTMKPGVINYKVDSEAPQRIIGYEVNGSFPIILNLKDRFFFLKLDLCFVSKKLFMQSKTLLFKYSIFSLLFVYPFQIINLSISESVYDVS
jgi:hypothetical protein